MALLERSAAPREPIDGNSADVHLDLSRLTEDARIAIDDIDGTAFDTKRQRYSGIIGRPMGRELLVDLVSGEKSLEIRRVARPEVEIDNAWARAPHPRRDERQKKSNSRQPFEAPHDSLSPS